MERGARLPVFIDYKSSCVIQCVGQLSSLAQDRVVHSIGQYDAIQYHVFVFHLLFQQTFNFENYNYNTLYATIYCLSVIYV